MPRYMLIKKNKLQKLIIRNLFYHKDLSCPELSELTGKSLPLVTKYVDELVREGIVVEKGFAQSSGGRRPLMFGLKKGTFYIIAVAMDQLITKIALINEQNEIEGEIGAFDLTLANNPNALLELTAMISSFIAEHEIPVKKVLAIGIGMPGFVDAVKGVNYSFMPVADGTIVSNIEASLGVPVFIDNDSSLIALAELKWGVARKKQQVMVINIGWGVGLGIIADGKLFRGHDGFAGEFSHIPIFDNSKLCACGKYGCLETETSLIVVAQKAIAKLKDGGPTLVSDISETDYEDAARKIIEAARGGDKFSIEVLSESAYNIGRGVAILIHLLNPELIVISGRGSLAGKVWIAPIQQAINEHCIPKIAEHAEIKISTIGQNAELIGAAALAMDNYEKIQTIPERSRQVM